MRSVSRGLIVLLLGLGAATSAMAQPPGTPVDTLKAPEYSERSSWENGSLSRFNMDRAALGPRAQGMGGAGVALLGGPEYQVLNAASILGVTRPELEAEAKIYSGSAGTQPGGVPSELDLGGGLSVTASDYRVRPREVLDYNSLSFGLPVTLLGKRGVLAATYSRVASTGTADETRVELRGDVTNGADATYGLGILPEDGMDAVSLAIAREMAPWLDLGVNLNWQSGTLTRKQDIGVAVFGFAIFDGFSEFKQDVSAFNVDLGGRLEVGPAQLGGCVYLEHDLTFENAQAKIKPVPNPQDPREVLVLSRPHDHTTSVPMMYSLGIGYQATDRITVAADFWARPWKKSEITRTRIESLVGFFDPDDPTTYFFQLVPANNDSLWEFFSNTIDPSTGLPFIQDPEKKSETFNAGLDNTHSFRLGVEYLFVDNEDFSLPVRIGFRSENQTLNSIKVDPFQGIPDSTMNRDTDYIGLVGDYFVVLQGLQVNPTDPNLIALRDEIQQQLKDVTEHNHAYFQGETISTSVVTFGLGVRWQNFEADLTFERVSYDLDRFFLQGFDPLLNPVASEVGETRGLTNISFAVRMGF